MKLAAFFLLLGVSLFGCSSALGNYYICFNEDKTKSVLFAWNNAGIYREHSFFPFKEQKLTAQHAGGEHNTSNTADKISLSLIQDTVHLVIKKPSGEFVDYNSKALFDDIYSVGHAITYAATIPNMHTYIFDKHNKSLKLHYKRMSAVRLPSPKWPWVSRPPYKKKYWIEKGEEYSNIEILGDLTASEIENAFFAHQHESSFLFPNCKEKISLIGKFLHWIKVLSFP